MFHKNLHHYITIDTQKNEDGLSGYNSIAAHVFGKKHLDVTNAKSAINKYQINPNNTLRLEYTNWESLFSNLKYAQDKPMGNSDKMAWLTERFYKDPRPALVSTFVNCAISNFDYHDTMENVIL